MASTTADIGSQQVPVSGEPAGVAKGRPGTLRMTLLLGFAGVLLLMGAVAVDSARQLRDVTLDSSRLRRDYIDRDRLMDKLRAGIYHASTVMRDGLLARDETARDSLRAELAGLRRQNEETLSLYINCAAPSERPALDALRQRSRKYFDALQASLALSKIHLPGIPRKPGTGESVPRAKPAWTDRPVPGLPDHVATQPGILIPPSEALLHNATVPETGTRREPRSVLHGGFAPPRAGLIALVSQVDALNQRDVTAGEERIQTLQAHFQRRVESLSVVAIALSTILAVIVVLRQQRLEREAALRFAEIQDARRDLRLLSNRLLAAQEEERRNLSRELHDQVGQSMSAMLMDLGRIESRLSDPQSCREILVSARRTAEENVARVRDLSLLLRPSMLDELGLVPALQWQAREVTRRTGLRVKMIAGDLDRPLPDEHRTCVFRIVQEALHNCVKHANATEARVVFTVEDDALLVSVQDNGSGFDPRRQKGLGLLGIEERAKHLGGDFSLDSGPGSGTVLSVRLPLSSGEAGVVERNLG